MTGQTDADTRTAVQVRDRFRDLLADRVAPLLGVCADALGVGVSVLVEDRPVLVCAGPGAGPGRDVGSPPPAPLVRQTADLPGVGPCTLVLSATPGCASARREEPPPAGQLSPVEHLARTLHDLLVRTAQEAQSRVEEDLRRGHFLHQYIHGISALSSNVAGLFRVLDLSSGGPGAPAPAADGTPPDRRAFASDLVRTIDYLVRTEKNNALNWLANLMPDYLPGVERATYVVINPMDVLQEILPVYAHQARKLFIEIEIDPAAQPAAMPAVRLERQSFQRLLHNVLSNAVKYSYHGILVEGSPRERVVRVSCRPRHDAHGRTCLLSFQNYGIGIEPDEHTRIGEPGYRGRLARREVEIGTGLGVSEAKRIAQAHGGHLSIHSRPVHGSTYLTTVNVILPITARPRRGNAP
jgi:signal transduction histidine kinase